MLEDAARGIGASATQIGEPENSIVGVICLNYYMFHIGDYASHTAHLSAMEDLAYRRMLDLYYRTQKPLPDVAQVARLIRLPNEAQSVQAVLDEFFTPTDEGWRNSRSDREIEAYEKVKKGGKDGAAKRWGKRGDGPLIAPLSPPQTPPNSNHTHKPLTTNQEPLLEDPNGSLSAAKLPDCPHQQILALWKQKCPMLAQPRTWEGARRASLKSRWIQASKPSAYSPDGYKTEKDGLDWWDGFFGYIAESSLADGFASNGRSWKPDLEWVVNATNFQKIIDGKYER